MRSTEFIVVKKKRSFVKILFKLAAALMVVMTACAVVYKYLENQYRSKILGKIDLDGDGEAEAIMIDTTGNDEVDTIIIDTDIKDSESDE